MTGIGSDESELFILGSGYFAPNSCVETFSWSGVYSDDQYISQLTGLGTSYDMDISGGLVWAACDGSDSPVRAFDTTGSIVDIIPGALVGNEARGVAFESANILWVSNPTDDKIYRIDLCTSVGERVDEGFPLPVLLRAIANPFSTSVVIEGLGFGDRAILEIFDASGRLVERTGFDGSFCWDAGDVPAGIYAARVSDGSAAESIRLTRL